MSIKDLPWKANWTHHTVTK